MRCNRTVALLLVSLLLITMTRDRIGAQGAQQQGTALSTRLELSSASAAAKAEFWAGIDDWQNFAWTSAEKHFQHAVALDQSFGLARVFANGAPPLTSEAAAAIERDRAAADATRQSTTEGLVALAWREYSVGRMPRVAQILHTAMQLMPDESRITTEYIWALSGSDDKKAALDTARAYQKRFPTYAPLVAPVSSLSLTTGDTAGALRAGEEYTRLASQKPGSFGWYGRMLQGLGRYDEAEAQFRQAIALAPAHADYPFEAASALAEMDELRGRNADARAVATQALARALDATDSATYMTIVAGTYLVANDLRQAMTLLETARQKSNAIGNRLGYDHVDQVLAETNATFGDHRSVPKYLEQMRAIEPSDSVVMILWHALEYGYSGQNDSVMVYSTRLLATATPQTQWRAQYAHLARGLGLQATKQCARALEEFALSDSTNAEVQAPRAECELQQGHRAAALALRDKVVASRDFSFFRPALIRARMRMVQMK